MTGSRALSSMLVMVTSLREELSRTPADISVALTRATALWQGLDVADALSHTGAVSTGSVFAPWSEFSLSAQDGGPLGPSSQSGPGSADTLVDTDFVGPVG